MSFRFGFQKKSESIKVSYLDNACQNALTNVLITHFKDIPLEREIIFFCVGTDRSTGDSLGPLVGSKLSGKKPGRFSVFGTLDEPVHAVNMSETLTAIGKRFHQPFIVAIDACLGQISSVGNIQIGQGSIKPGAGVQKNLPPVGDMHITGIVNVSGFMEYFVLQNTRLSQVMNMAQIISDSVYYALIQSDRHHSHMPAANLSKYFLKTEQNM